MLSLFPLLGVVYDNARKLTLKNGLESVIFSFKIFCVFSWCCSLVRENMPGVRDALDLIPALVKFWLKAEIPLFGYLYFLKYLFTCVGVDAWGDGAQKSFSVPGLSAFSSEAVSLLEVEFVNSRLSGSQQAPVIFLPPPPQSLDTDPGKDT